jgi:hypothetical protein
VAVLVGEGQQDVKRGGGQREKGVCIHSGYITCG